MLRLAFLGKISAVFATNLVLLYRVESLAISG
jgi:hypothetical protein